jgi:hypothetical protein
MTVYTVTGHMGGRPKDPNVSETTLDAMKSVGVGQPITLTLPGPEDTAVKGHGALK